MCTQTNILCNSAMKLILYSLIVILGNLEDEITKEKYEKLKPRFKQVLPMDDVVFLASLIAADLIKEDCQESISKKPSRAKMASEFLKTVIENDFFNNGNNDSLKKLLEIMEKSSFIPAKELAKEFKGIRSCMLYYTIYLQITHVYVFKQHQLCIIL